MKKPRDGSDGRPFIGMVFRPFLRRVTPFPDTQKDFDHWVHWVTHTQEKVYFSVPSQADLYQLDKTVTVFYDAVAFGGGLEMCDLSIGDLESITEELTKSCVSLPASQHPSIKSYTIF